MRRTATRLLLAAVLLIPATLVGPAPAAAQEETGSAETVSGTGEFADLKVTVSQTKNLINQTVRVSWTGGRPTEARPSAPAGANFLQIMQCWGDDPTGPDRTQCQFGAAQSELPETGQKVRERFVGRSTEGELPAAGPQDDYLPFWPIDRPRPTALTADQTTQFFDAQLTNEVGAALTRSDGEGQVEFELQTLQQAAGLGCGTPVGETTAVRPCWLVVVPRGTTNADGTSPGSLPIQGSPLDLRVWKDRIVVRLDFFPQRNACPFGEERPVTGHEVVTEAVSRWQPALCADGGTVYGYTQQTDQLIRSQLAGTQPNLAITSDPVSAEQLQGDRDIVYAPVAVSGLTLAFNINANLRGEPPDDPRRAVDGQQFTEMNLTPRLVAKLLTQSYRAAVNAEAVPESQSTERVPARPARLVNNATSLQSDPEFLKFNPQFLGDATLPVRGLVPANPHLEPLAPGGTSDLAGLLWEWVLADSTARAFVDGTPDEWGMVVNDLNKGLQLPVDSFPRTDQLCRNVTVAGGPLGLYTPSCPLDMFPYTNDMNQAARAASRGTTLGRGATATQDNGVVKLNGDARQPVGARALMAIADAATAERYRLPTAKLRNSAGQFVAPDAAGLRAGLAAMKPSTVDGVLSPDPTTTDPTAYPLTSVSYAATVPSLLDEAAARDYAGFLRYAAVPGQKQGEAPGQLPFGYFPMPEQLQAQTLAAAATIERRGATAGASPDTTPLGPGATLNQSGPRGSAGTSVGGVTRSGSTAAGSSPAGGATSLPAAVVPGPAGSAGPAPAGAAPPAAAPAIQPVASTQPTPALPAPPVGALLVALLIGGGLAAAAAPITHLIGQRRGSAPASQPKRPTT